MTDVDDLDRLLVPPGLRENARAALSQPSPLRAVAQVLVDGVNEATLAEAAASAMMLRAEAPMDRVLWAITDVLLYSQVPNYHWGMVADAPRNAAYAAAIAACIEPGMTVLEIGAGTGLLAMLAARAGAGHVFTVEANPLMARVARACIASNGFGDQITVVDGHSTRMSAGTELPERADVLIHEILSSDLVGEGVVPSVAHAKAELLVPNATLLPERLAAVGVLANSPSRHYLQEARVEGFDLSPLATIDAASLKSGTRGCLRLSDPAPLVRFDLRRDLPHRGEGTMHMTATTAGQAGGVEQWIAMAFPDDTSLTSDDPTSHWSTCFHPFGTSVDVVGGTALPIAVAYTPEFLSVGLADVQNAIT
ncbi:MAG: 50S ribosomal protein L11 methyltransferase [Pseudomonadota bacterium]